MKEYRGKSFDIVEDRDGGLSLQDMAFVDCDFYNCTLSFRAAVSCRSTAKNISISKSRFHHCYCGPAILEDSVVDGVKSIDTMIFWGTLFKGVVLKGDIFDFKTNTTPDMDASAALAASFDQDRKRFYAQGAWALDITQARLRTFDSFGIPARLIKIDEETQAVLVKDRFTAPKVMNEIDRGSKWFPYIDWLLASDENDVVIATPLRASKASRDRHLADLKTLRTSGLVD